MASTSILLVDTIASYRSAVAGALRKRGHDVWEAASAAAAVSDLDTRHANIAIVDNALPDRRGIDLLATIRDCRHDTRLVLVVEPTFEDDCSPEWCASHGVSLVLHGPVHPDAMVKHIDNLLLGRTPLPFAPPKPRQSMAKGFAGDANTEDHLQSVRRSYQQKLPEELEKLGKVLRAAHMTNDAEAMREVYRLSHTLHGTAGTLGFNEVSSAAARIESVVKKLMAGVQEQGLWDTMFDCLEHATQAPERPSLVINISPKVAAGIATVLILDPDEDMLASVQITAKRNLVTVIATTDLGESPQLALEHKVDGVIVDMDMVGIDAASKFIQQLRATEGLAELPAAFMSGNDSITYRTAAAHAGATHFLSKPLNADDLLEAARYFTAVRSKVNAKILIVDDDEYFRAHVAAILRGVGMDVSSLGEPERVLEVMEQTRPDILLLDVVMPKVSGFDVCRMIRSTGSGKDMPVLFLTAESSPEVRLECFRSGGDDYIEKPVIKEELLARIGVRLERIRLFKERADRDALTTLPNRRAFLDMLKIRLAEGQRYSKQVSLCLMDIDRFKHVNDTYGHLAGDRVLSGLGKLLSARFRTMDVRGRWGGEEFCVAFYGEPPEVSRMILGRVLEEFKLMTFEGDQGEVFHCSFSAGIATYPTDGETTHELFRNADERLYKAKQNGRSRIDID
ncbi:MAG: response regulator [Myxococcota bacterium]|nr:response regulator [Myxococcota bacterium]